MEMKELLYDGKAKKVYATDAPELLLAAYASKAGLEEMKRLAFRIHGVMKEFFKARKVDLVDYKPEFGRIRDGSIVLTDEISPDTCRFWDGETHERLDKDRFRRELGNIEGAYREMPRRILGQ